MPPRRPAATRRSRRVAPPRDPDFARLWAGQTVSVFGSMVTRAALPFTAVLFLNARPMQMAFQNAADVAPGLVIGLFAGAWVDRLRRRPVMIAADVARALLLASIPAAAALGALSMPQLYVVGFLVGALSVTFDVAYISYLPTLVSRERVLAANSKLAASAAVAETGAFGIGGWLVQWLGGPLTLLVDAATFLFSAACVGAIRAPEPAPVPASQRASVRHEIVAGLRTVWRDPILRSLALWRAVLEISFGIGATLFVLYCARTLGFGTGVLGMIFAVGGASSFAGAVLATRAGRRLGIGPAMVVALFVMALARVLPPLAQGTTLAAVALLVTQQLVGDGAHTIFEIHSTSLMQRRASDALLGRVTASLRFVSIAAMLAGSFAGGALGESIGPRAALFMTAGLALLAAIGFAFSPVRSLRDPASAAVDAPPAVA
jgi:MFS family permease